MIFLLKHWKIAAGALIIVMVLVFSEWRAYRAVQEVERTILIERQENYIDTRERIDNATKNTRNLDGDAALDWLRNRQQSK